MLALSRKNAQAVVIGDADRPASTPEVTVLELTCGRGTLGLETIEDAPVQRERGSKQISASRAREPPAKQPP